jgi:hypothetical protein
MFRCNHHPQIGHYSIFLKLLLLKESIKMHRRGQFGSVAAYLIRSLLVYVWCTVRNQTQVDAFQLIIRRKVTLARSNTALPDDGDYT